LATGLAIAIAPRVSQKKLLTYADDDIDRHKGMTIALTIGL
jgi:hypothetical protein